MKKISKKLSKSGAEMTIGTLVIIVLAIIVLVVLALGFGAGWSNLWSKMKGFFGGGVNVDDIKQACTYACTTSASYDYCCVSKEVAFEKGADNQMVTCKSGESDSRMGLTPCREFNCAEICKAIMCEDVNLKVNTDTCTSDTTKKLDSKFKPIGESQKCCVPVATKVCEGSGDNALGGLWKDKTTSNVCPKDNNKDGTDITSQVTNDADKTSHDGKICCKYS